MTCPTACGTSSLAARSFFLQRQLISQPVQNLIKQFLRWCGVGLVGQRPRRMAEEMGLVAAIFLVGFDDGRGDGSKRFQSNGDPLFLRHCCPIRSFFLFLSPSTRESHKTVPVLEVRT